MGNTTKRWKSFWERRRQRKAVKLRHLEGSTRTLDQASETLNKHPFFSQ